MAGPVADTGPGDPMQRPLLLTCLVLFALAWGCQSNRREGRVFQPYTPPAANESLVYVHRIDSLRGVGPIDVRIDDEKLGDMRDKEYLALVLADGDAHRLSVRRRWLGLIPLAWSDLEFRVEPGTTAYLRVWAGYEHHQIEGSAGTAPGRSDGSTSVSLFAARWDAKRATRELKGCRRAPGA